VNATVNPTPKATAGFEHPVASRAPIPIGLLVLLSFLVFCGMFYFDLQGGWSSPQVYQPYRSDEELALFQPPVNGEWNKNNGARVYGQVCGLCHNPDGMGKPGQFPPFVGSEWVLGTPDRLVRIPILGLNGPIKIKGQQWNLSMPAQGASMSDEDIADVLCYIRTSWGNKGSLIKPEQVRAIRKAIGSRAQPWSEAELLAIPAK
jgi:mono/diheme cytochrome c family protein